jgi:tetratricopeptide (TPR) repeat protein
VIALAVVAGSVALVVGLGRAAGPRAAGHIFLSGALFFTLGAVATVVRLVGGPGSAPGRPSLRHGCGMVAVGAVMLGLDYVDGWVAVETTRANFRAALDRGQTAAKAGDWARAVDAYSAAVRLDPDSADARRRRGAAYLHLGELDRALADLEVAARLDPADVGVVYNRGVAKAQLGDVTGALADFSEAIRLDPTRARAYQARGEMHARTGNAAGAEADRRRAAELDPALNKGGWLDL